MDTTPELKKETAAENLNFMKGDKRLEFIGDKPILHLYTTNAAYLDDLYTLGISNDRKDPSYYIARRKDVDIRPGDIIPLLSIEVVGEKALRILAENHVNFPMSDKFGPDKGPATKQWAEVHQR